MSRVVRILFFSIFSFAIVIPSVSAQQAQDPGATPAPQKLDKEAKRKMKRTLKELDSAYRQWLTEDVTYIISPDERNAFLQLDTNEEREQFIEQFWLRRSSNPDLPEKDAPLHVPGAGLSMMESMGMASKADPFTRPDGTNFPTTTGCTPARMN